jgi:hypothetical protein
LTTANLCRKESFNAWSRSMLCGVARLETAAANNRSRHASWRFVRISLNGSCVPVLQWNRGQADHVVRPDIGVGFAASDQTQFARVDIGARRVDDRIVIDMDAAS